jgi:hypothetical protein
VISDNPAIGFVSHAWKFGGALSNGKVLAPAKSIGEMQRIIFNDYVDATLSILFVTVVVAVVVYGLISIRKAFTNPNVTAIEIGAAAPAVERVHA